MFHPIHFKSLLLLLLFGMGFLSASCDPRREIYDDETLKVYVILDWNKAGIKPNGATVWFFPRYSGRSPKVLRTNSLRDSLMLPRDSYSVLVFNESESDFSTLRFRGTDRYETFEAYTRPLGEKTTTSEEELCVTPEVLAVSCIEAFDIGQQSILDDSPVALAFVPERIMTTVRVSVRINGLDNIRLKASTASLSGLSEGIYLFSRQPSGNPVTHRFAFTQQNFDEGSYKNGIISGAFYIFGLCSMPVVRQRVSLYLGLRDGTSYPCIARDVTDLIKPSTRSELFFNIELGVGNSEGDLPILIPDVPDNEDDSDTGFDAVVDGWGEEIETDIPI